MKFLPVFIAALLMGSFYLEAGNKNLLPLGEREALIANTGIALSDSAGGAIYNPANLADLEHPRLSASATTYGFSDYQLRDNEATDGVRYGFGVKTFLPIPQSTIQTFNFFGATQAISLTVPSLVRFSKRVTINSNNLHTVVLASSEAQEVRLGFSWAQTLSSLSPDLSVGATVYGTRLTSSSIATASGQITSVANSMGTSLNRTEATVIGLGGVLGLRYKIFDQLAVGARLESSILQLTSGGEDFAQSTELNQGILKVSEFSDTQDPSYDQPWDLGMGINWTPWARLHLLLDFSMQFPQSYRQNDEIEIKSKWTPRLNGGVIFKLYRPFEICAGMQWNPSNEVSSDPAKTDFLGGTLGVRYRGDNFHFGVGGFFLTSDGRTSGIADSTTLASIKTRAFGFTLVSGTSF